MRARWVMLCLGLGFLPSSPSHAEDMRLMSVAIRGGVSGQPVFGGEEIETFRQYDALVTAGLPWSWYSEAGWGVGTRLMASAGALLAEGETGFVGTLFPAIAVGRRNSQASLDVGFGGALLTRHKFGDQNFGGAFQVVLTLGLRVPVYRSIGVGYWLQHLSDVKIYGANGKGADLHMFGLTYSFR